MSGDLEDILKRLGWNDGFQIPIANAENKALEEELARLTLKKTKTKNILDRASDRLQSLKDHFKYVSQENEQTQKLITAHKQQFENVEHQFHISKAEMEGVQQDIKQGLKQLRDSQERELMKKNELQKAIARAETLKTEADWDAEALKAWEEALKKRDDDNELIKKFSIEDERKYNELEARRQLLQVECDRQRGLLAKMIAEYHNYEMIVERTGKVIKQQMIERDALIKQWKETVKMLQQRDTDIAKAQELIATTHELVEKQLEKLEEENGFLLNEQKNNREIDLQIQNLNMINSRLRQDYNELTQYLLLLNSELHTLKRDVNSASLELENERIKGRQLNQTIDNKEMMCIKYQEDIEKIQNKLKDMQNSTLSAADKIKRIEKLIEFEEKQYNIYLSDTEKLNAILYRSEKLLKEQLSVSKTLVLGISNGTCHCNHLRKHIRNETKDLEDIKEVVYNMEFRIDDYEKSLCKIERDTKRDDYSEEKEKQIQELEQILADHKDVHHTLQNQVNRLQEEMNRLTNSISIDKEQLELLQDRCEQHLLVNAISKKHIAAAKQSTQEKQVEENMMLLRMNQIDKDMKREEKQIYSMEKLRLNLDQAMLERQIEINTNKMIIQAKRRSLDEDRGRLKADIALRLLKIEQIQKKYHIALMAMGKDEDGQPLSVTHFKIKNAQEKFMLQQEGDELDKKIKVAEKEIVAMENTLKIVNLTNYAFKNSLAPVKDEDEEVQEMNSLEQELKQTTNVLREHRRELSTKQEEIEELHNKLTDLDTNRNKTKEMVDNLEQEVQLVHQQECDKAEKVKRAECQIKRVLKRLSKVDISNYDRDFEIRQMRDGNKNVMQRLMGMCTGYPETAPLINRYMMEHSIMLPQKKLSSSGSSSTLSLYSLTQCSSTYKVTNTARSESSQGSEGSQGSRTTQGSSILNKIDISFPV